MGERAAGRQERSEVVPATAGSGRLFEERRKTPAPIECLGITFASDDVRRAHFLQLTIFVDDEDSAIRWLHQSLTAQNFLRYDGAGDVPGQIHAYLSSNFKGAAQPGQGRRRAARRRQGPLVRPRPEPGQRPGEAARALPAQGV